MPPHSNNILASAVASDSRRRKVTLMSTIEFQSGPFSISSCNAHDRLQVPRIPSRCARHDRGRDLRRERAEQVFADVLELLTEFEERLDSLGDRIAPPEAA
jgi:hypothetical protein